ncbi:MAG: outer membrane beta-barrel protein [Campylobacterota bacterium]|nr:outer membrane beta-barrel protein [Campylobacterota bacterium]
MKKIVTAVLTLLLTSSLINAEESNELSGFYVGAGLAIHAVPNDWDDNGLGLVLKGGAALPQVLNNLGMEVELTTSLSDPETHNGHDVSILTLAGYMTYNIRFPDSHIFVRPRAGFILPNLGDTKSVNSRNFGISTGIAAVVELNKQMNVYGDYTNLGENINNYTVGVELKF